MDPISAVGLASSIIAFIDFSWELVAGTWEIYRSPDGIPDQHARLEDVIEDLKLITRPLQAEVPANTVAETNIARLARYCQDDSKTLLKLLCDLRSDVKRRTIWSSLNAKWKSILKKKEVSELVCQLQENRAEIQLHIIVMMREEQSTFGTQLKTIEADCRDLKRTLPNHLREVRNDIIKTLEDQRSSDLQDSSGFDHSLSHIKQQLQAVQSMLTEIPLQHRILRHLITDNMHSRRNQIIDANPDTCRWILEDSEDYLEASESESDSNGGSSPDSTSDADSDVDSGSIESSPRTDSDWETELQHRCEIRSRFTDWLATGQDVLHLSGNIGSGKSTLMKFIAQHERTRKELETWAGTKRLILCQFYFWSAGTESQQSMPGLYRSLLFQTLSQCPDLIEKVFCTQVDRMRRSGAQADPAVERVQGFDDAQVQAAFELLLQQAHDSDYRMCFVLDGLDEFKGKPLDHEDLASKLKSWTLKGNVKLLVSSRPWPEYENVFVANATIYLHQLNRFDIETYCFERVKQDREFNQIRDREEMREIKDVVDDIVSGSQGNFLWAHLVLDNILQGIRQGDSITTLRAKVEEYPADLDTLYDKLREPIETKLIDSNRANRMLLLAIHAPGMFYLPAITFSWILDDSNSGLLDPEFPTDNQCRPYSEAEATKRIQRVIKQINSLTRGMLELDQSRDYEYGIGGLFLNTYFTSPGIRFCHRSARDYLVLNEARYQRACSSWPGFHDSDVYGRIHLARLLYGVSLFNIAHARLLYGASTDECARRLCGSPLNRYLNSSYCRSFDPNTIRKFESPLRPFLRRGFYLGPIHASPATRGEPSFLQCCAWCGLDKFVLTETIEPSARINTGGSSILLSVLHRSYGEFTYETMDMLLQLLDRRLGIDAMITVWKLKGMDDSIPLEPRLPAWVVVSWSLLNKMSVARYLAKETRSRDPTFESAVAALRRLHEYGKEKGERLSLTLGIAEGSFNSVKTERQFGAAEIVEWLEEECNEVRKAIATSSTVDQAQWSWCARTTNGNQSTCDMMQHTPGEWLKENGILGDCRQRGSWSLAMRGIHWESVGAQVDINEWNIGFRVL